MFETIASLTLDQMVVLPPAFQKMASFVFLQDLNQADSYLLAACAVLTVTIFIQLRAFARPPPVPLKRLPRRPAISILFKPDDITSTSVVQQQQHKQGRAASASASATAAGAAESTSSATRQSVHSSMPPWKRKLQNIFRSAVSLNGATGTAPGTTNHNGHPSPAGTATDHLKDQDDDNDVNGLQLPPKMDRWMRTDRSTHGSGSHVGDDDDDDDDDDSDSMEHSEPVAEPPVMHDLPDSFAPLLSSSQMEVLTNELTADLIHACTVTAGVRLAAGRHEVPLDKDQSRPQLVLDIPTDGCRVSAVVRMGSDGLSTDEDLDVSRPTSTRSKPMVKHAGLVFDPPLPLVNVAPTLIHFPTLFQDRATTTLRRIQIVRLAVDFIISISSFLEKCLWILENQCQIYLSKVRVYPVYKGRSSGSKNAPEWRLSLSFSGHVLLFGWIPIPFIGVTLPTFVIPQPHALLEYLLSAQPLASAKLRPENIAKERIVLAAIDAVESWNADVKVVATPPAVGVDLTLPGGVTIALELELGCDPGAGRNRAEADPSFPSPKMNVPTQADTNSGNSMSSWTTHQEKAGGPTGTPFKRRMNTPSVAPSVPVSTVPPFDANTSVPWFLELSAKGSVSHEKMSVHILKMATRHEDSVGAIPVKSQFATRGSLAFWKGDPSTLDPVDLRRRQSFGHNRVNSLGHNRVNSFGRPALEREDSPSVAAILLFPDETSSFHNELRMLQYDYAFDVFEDTKVDAITLTVGATHPMLNGGTMVTTILDSIYAYGSVSAREHAVLDPIERRRKRNILRHLPATDFTFGIQNVYMPPESSSYSDDGLTLFLPELEGGRMMVRFLGGTKDDSDDTSTKTGPRKLETVSEGIKVVADFEVASLVLQTEGVVKEFPELDIFEGVKLRTNLSGIIGGSIRAHLRPQKLTGPVSTTGPNYFNPLEAYEIDFSQSSLSVKMKEYSAALGHRRVIFPAESTFVVTVLESVVDMGFEGATVCGLSWDFQGLSPILQVTEVGQSPAEAVPENKEQVSLLITPLRQGRLSFRVSSVGGISIFKAATSREDKEGLYDWKFFNALVSPDEESGERIMEVLHDKRTMDKLLQVVKYLNKDLHGILRYVLSQVWRAKEIFDQEGVSDPGHVIPMYKMARLVSLFLSGGVKQVDAILPIIKGVIAGEGLDVVQVKELMRKHLDAYDEWAPEIDRGVRWAALLTGPVAAAQPYVEAEVVPLAEIPHHAAKFQEIPSADQLYERLLEKPQLPLDPGFSNLVGRVAPYLSFQQIEYFLQARGPTYWQPSDLRRLRYVYSIKRKALQIAESYGGLSFLPQSFMVSVFLGEATRTSLRASHLRKKPKRTSSTSSAVSRQFVRKAPALSRLRRRRVSNLESPLEFVAEVPENDDLIQSPAERIAALSNFVDAHHRERDIPSDLVLGFGFTAGLVEEQYELADCLLGPQDVAILLQAGLTSVMKASTVVQLNQRMLLDLICSQPHSFAVAVLAEIGAPGSQGSPRSLTSALMALLELDQTAFKPSHQIDLHTLLESWVPGLKIPRREDYMAGGRWARQSYYEAIFAVSKSILEDAETYVALKGHVQRVRKHVESDPSPRPREDASADIGLDFSSAISEVTGGGVTKLKHAIDQAISQIKEADNVGDMLMEEFHEDETLARRSDAYKEAVKLYRQSFSSCARVLALDKHAFQSEWFRAFYRRNNDALMIKSIYDNLIEDVDNVRHWLQALRNGSKQKHTEQGGGAEFNTPDSQSSKAEAASPSFSTQSIASYEDGTDRLFLEPEKNDEQVLIDAIIDATIFDAGDRERLRNDPLVRLLIPNPPGHYNFVIVSAMGVITEGKKGLELIAAYERLEAERGVKAIRADTGTARSMEYNASKIQQAIEVADRLGKPYGLLGYSQGCANILMAESSLLSGSPKQQQALIRPGGGLVCRQLLFSAANGSFHGPATEIKAQRLIVMCEEFFKYQQGYFSRALSSAVLEALNSILDSAHFHKFMGGAQSFLQDGCRAFWRESQHLAHVPTCTLSGVMEEHTTPEALEMISHLLTKQSGSPLHDSQVHVFDAVGHPVYHNNRNGRMLKRCAIGEGAIQRTHHWSPLCEEVAFLQTPKDIEMGSFDCAKDRHVFPWVDVNVRFGFIKYTDEIADDKNQSMTTTPERHPMSFVRGGLASPGATPMQETPKKVALYSMVALHGTKSPLRETPKTVALYSMVVPK